MLQWLPDNLHVSGTRPELHPTSSKQQRGGGGWIIKIWAEGEMLQSSADNKQSSGLNELFWSSGTLVFSV